MSEVFISICFCMFLPQNLSDTISTRKSTLNISHPNFPAQKKQSQPKTTDIISGLHVHPQNHPTKIQNSTASSSPGLLVPRKTSTSKKKHPIHIFFPCGSAAGLHVREHHRPGLFFPLVAAHGSGPVLQGGPRGFPGGQHGASQRGRGGAGGVSAVPHLPGGLC